MVQIETHSLVETTLTYNKVQRWQLFEGAVFYGGNFKVNINSSSPLTEARNQQAYKRINCLFDSSDDKASLSLT